MSDYSSFIDHLYPVATLTDELITEGHSPLFVMGVVAVIIARQLEKYNYTPDDFVDFLDQSKDLAWYPDPHKKPVLTLIKNENFTKVPDTDS